MKWLLQLKEIFKSFYERYDRYVNGVLRFLLAIGVFLTEFYYTGYNSRLQPVLISAAGALACAFLPSSFITVLMCLILLAEMISVSLEVTAVAALLILLMLLLYFVFRAGKSTLIAVTFLLCCLKIPAVLLPLGLLISPVEIVVVFFGVVLYTLVLVVKKDFSILSSSTALTLGGRVNLLISDILNNERFLLIITVLAASLLLICIISRSRINYAPRVAVIAGNFLFLVLIVLGNFFIGVEVDYLMVLAGILINVPVSFLIIALVIHADYRHTEIVRFEDDEYYYFVRAVPKTSVAVTEKRVESITAPDEPGPSYTETDPVSRDIFMKPSDRQKEARQD